MSNILFKINDVLHVDLTEVSSICLEEKHTLVVFGGKLKYPAKIKMCFKNGIEHSCIFPEEIIKDKLAELVEKINEARQN